MLNTSPTRQLHINKNFKIKQVQSQVRRAEKWKKHYRPARAIDAARTYKVRKRDKCPHIRLLSVALAILMLASSSTRFCAMAIALAALGRRGRRYRGWLDIGRIVCDVAGVGTKRQVDISIDTPIGTPRIAEFPVFILCIYTDHLHAVIHIHATCRHDAPRVRSPRGSVETDG